LKTYIGNSTDIIAVQKVLSVITISYSDDFAKYKGRIPVLQLREVMGSVVKQSGGKFIYF